MNIKKRHKWTNEELASEAIKYSTRSEFSKLGHNAYMVAHRRNILDKICSHMSYVKIQWTNEMLSSEAIKYKSRTEFANNSRSAYFTAINRNILNSICVHMVEIIHYWTDEELQSEALKYKTRGEFQKENVSAYTCAHKRKILNKICSHMKKSCGTSTEEQELFNIILNKHPTAKTFRDMKVKIENKPHIEGFDIDIYVPELMLGIEFDGTFHHSFDGLKRARPNWSDEDIRNYHALKDNWFYNKGIKILHINQSDWKSDKQSCIDKCLSFLRGNNVEQVA